MTKSGMVDAISTTESAGLFLHNLRIKTPDKLTVETVIADFPKSLQYKNAKGEVPIQSAARCAKSMSFVPLLAQQAIKHNILTSERGGLFLPVLISNPPRNIIQWLTATWSNRGPKSFEVECLQALKDLRGANLLKNEDYILFGLINHATYTTSLSRLNYLLGANPSCLSTKFPNGDFPIHLSNYRYRGNIKVFETLLKYGAKYHPVEFGYLFKKNKYGRRAICQAIAKYGKEDTLRLVQKYIRSSDNHPILHHVFQYCPELSDDFVYRYPDAIFLKDRWGRHLLHIGAKNGLKLSGSLFMMIHSNKHSVEERDPVTNLYPFMLAASGKNKDLTTIFKLLSLRPDVLSSSHGFEE